MSRQTISIVLAVIAGLLAWTAAVIRYVRTGEIALGTIVAGVAIPAVIISIARGRTRPYRDDR